jgi:hypothetical protein
MSPEGLLWYRCANATDPQGSGAHPEVHHPLRSDCRFPTVPHRGSWALNRKFWQHPNAYCTDTGDYGTVDAPSAGFYSHARLDNYRYWCCEGTLCNDPGIDLAADGVALLAGVDGFSFSQVI